MITLLKFEIFDISASQLSRCRNIEPHEYFAAEITDYCGGCFQKVFLKPFKDYSTANSVGSRGIFASYFLEENKLYEVQCSLNWKKQDHYFCIIETGNIKRLSIQEAVLWLNTHLV